MLNDMVPGSVIYAFRINILPPMHYEHYGIYIGNNEVIHFNNEKGAHKVTLQSFMDYTRRSEGFVKPFPETREALKIILKNRMKNPEYVERALKELAKDGYQFFTSDQVIQRAKNAVDDSEWVASEYSLRKKNCEHFAFWCKTGIKNSTQVEHYSKIIFG